MKEAGLFQLVKIGYSATVSDDFDMVPVECSLEIIACVFNLPSLYPMKRVFMILHLVAIISPYKWVSGFAEEIISNNTTFSD